MKRTRRSLLVAIIALVCTAHVGSPDVWYDGAAGPYSVRVHVQAPGVIPGIAVVNVRASDTGVERVTATANRFDATGGAPPPEIATRVDGRDGWFRTKLWIMTSGSYSITVAVSGTRGTGDVVVPLGAVPNRRLGFARPLGIALGVMGVVLFLGAVSIIGAGVREATLSPGAVPDDAQRKRARRIMLRAAAAFTLVLLGAWKWWDSEDAFFERTMFTPLTSAASVRDGVLTLSITDSAWTQRNERDWQRMHGEGVGESLVPDHGKLMHMFVIDSSGGRAFAHLHPVTSDSSTFTSPLPPLPTGRYTVFGDIVHASGFTQTLVASIELTAPQTAAARADGDDSFTTRSASATLLRATLDDGSTLTWLASSESIVAGQDADLRFAISSLANAPPLELYMGMPAHAVVVRNDARVFIHLHPLGTISMAAQDRLTNHPNAAHIAMPVPADTIAFPYAFPTAGTYTVWVQIKRGGRVLTGAFDVNVGDATR
ncbi:MAG TPA: hypothetical protein VJR92_00070 [Gemmatimonadaceae bacterium]|nr:hypothetical protein [Gemmatimonadaceae bacterium]